MQITPNLLVVLLVVSLFTLTVAVGNGTRSTRKVRPLAAEVYFIDTVQTGLAPVHRRAQVSNHENVPSSNLFRNLKAEDRALSNILANRFNFNGNGPSNTFRPIYNIVWPFVRNPTYRNGVLPQLDSCDANDGKRGVCMGPVACTRYGGTASGASCSIGGVCCVLTVKDCTGSVVALNNTYFQTPTTPVTSNSVCNLVVRLNKLLPEQKQAICQVRLDITSFSIAQPVFSRCATDSFQASGSLNAAPVICGDNDNQHMYLHVPPSDITPTELSLTFRFGAATITRSWNMRISFIPCAASYKAPDDCLQYITATSGTITSFNWRDVTPAIRQLVELDYKICFRSEIVNDKRATKMCISECLVNTAGNAFSISGPTNVQTSQAAVCTLNYVGYPGGYIVGTVTTGGGITYINPFRERYCGTNLHPFNQVATKVTVCTDTGPFEIHHRTGATHENDNRLHMGFCLNFQQSVP